MRRRSFFRLSTFTLSALALGPLTQVSLAASGGNILNQPWTGPYQGVPPYGKIEASHFGPALTLATKQYLTEIEAIAKNPQKPTFANVIEALEDSGRDFGRITTLMGVYTSTMNTPKMQELDREWSPKLTSTRLAVIQNGALFQRIVAVYKESQKADSPLTAEQKRLTWLYYITFSRTGAELNAKDKKALADLSRELAELNTKFSQNVLADEEKHWVTLDSAADLAGMPAAYIEAAKAAAKEKKMPDKWLIRNTRSAVQPFLQYGERRDLREKVFKMFVSRGDNGDAHDNNALVTKILKARQKSAKLMGCKSFAHWKLENSMAKTPENAMKLMKAVWPAAVARVREEVAEMQAIVDGEGGKFKIAPWDYRYYAEKVRKAKYDLDENEVKPYLQLEKIREAMFWMAEKLYGFHFQPVSGLPVLNADISTYEVKNRQGQHVGLWYFDPYARNGKVSGAWMNEYRTQENFRSNIHPIVSNNANFIKGTPCLLSFDDAETMFHEFGHALHGLNSNVHYPQLAGTNTPRDFVEFPSQLHENWFKTTEILSRFAVHNSTGQPIPAELVEKIRKASKFNQGFEVTEYLASAIVDMMLHLETSGDIDARAFEKKALAELGMPGEMVMRHRIPQFNHLFSSDGYSAGYYSYIWSEVLDHDCWEVFEKAGNPFDAATAARLQKCIMSVGNTLDSAQAYRNFRGRDPQIGGYLRAHGFPDK